MSQSNIYFDLEEIKRSAGLRNAGEALDYMIMTGDIKKYLLSKILIIIHDQRFFFFFQLEKYMYKNNKNEMAGLLKVLVSYAEVLRLAFDGVYREMREEK